MQDRLDAIEALTRAADANPARKPEAVRARLAESVAALMESGRGFDENRLHQEAILYSPSADSRTARRGTDGSEVTLDALGRFIIEPPEARRRGLPATDTEPPPNCASAVIFPPILRRPGRDHARRRRPLGAASSGDEHRGTIVARNDALALATLREGEREIVFRCGTRRRATRSGRVDRLLSVGNELTVDLYEDRRRSSWPR